VADDSPRDPGLARERTALAWNRSGLAVVVCIAAVLRHLWPLRGTGASVALASVAVAAMVWALGILALRSRTDHRHGHRAIGLMTLGTVVLACGGIALSLLTPG